MRRYRSAAELQYLGELFMVEGWPPEVSSLTLSYQVDPTLAETHKAFLELPIEVIELHLRRDDQFQQASVYPGPGLSESQCWRVYSGGNTKVVRNFAAQAQRKVALEMGLSPAKFQSFLPEYDEEFTMKYRYRYYVACRNGNLNCVRPSHLVIHRSADYEVKYPLLFRTHIRHKRS